MKLLLLNTICFSISWIIPRAFGDNYLIKKGDKVNHIYNATVSILIVLFYAYLDKTLLMVPYLLSLYWIFFDLLLNKLRGKELLFVGTTAWLDKSFRRIAIIVQEGLFKMFHVRLFGNIKLFILKLIPVDPGKVMLIAKLICLVISIWVFIQFAK